MSSSASRGSNRFPRTEVDDLECLPVCLEDDTLLLYDATTSEKVWISTQEPIDLRDFR